MLGVATYCIVQSVRDVRRKAYVMATLGVLAAGAVLLRPPPTGPISVTARR